MKQLGVDHICADPPGDWRGWDLAHLKAHRERIESFGLVLDMIQIPLASRPLAQAKMPDIMAAGPDRDAQIAACCAIIAACGKAGIPAVKYNFNYIGIPRSPPEPGRGGTRNEAFRWDLMDQDAPGPVGVLSEDENWSRIDYFLARVVPAAEAAGVRLACHPHDPYTPPGYMGVTRVLGTVEGLAKFIELRKSPLHGLNFCIGTVGEMLEDVAEVPAITRRFVDTGKVFNIHLRNIRGRRLSFMEVFPDEGDIDLPAVVEALAAGGYDGMVMPDHAPEMDGRDPKGTAFAFSYGYIAALLDRQRRLAAQGPRA
jgi:mannonate dehydratase